MPFHYADMPHKPLWPLDERDGAALACALISLAVAAFGGVGGGGILLPIYILVLDFRLKEAVALANATILGGAIANVWFSSTKRHPFVDRPLIAWDLILLFEPVVIFGTVLGSFANKLLPDVIVEIILVLLYGALSYQTMSRAIQYMEKEGGWQLLRKRLLPTTMNSPNAAVSPCTEGPSGQAILSNETAAHKEVDDTPNKIKSNGDSRMISERTPLFVSSADSDDDASYYSVSCSLDTDERFYNLPPSDTPKEVVVTRLKCQELSVRWWKPAAMTLCFAGMVSLRIGQKAVRCGSTAYWILTLGLIPWVLPFFLLARRHVIKDVQTKQLCGFPFPPGDVKWTTWNSVRWPLICSLAGVMSGMLGSSGGSIKAPLLLELGTPPTVVSATVAQMVMFTSASSSLALLVLGFMPTDYGPLLFAYGGLITFVTNWAASHFLGRRRTQSVPMLSIALIITLSTITMGLQAGVRLSEDPAAAKKFGRLCD